LAEGARRGPCARSRVEREAPGPPRPADRIDGRRDRERGLALPVPHRPPDPSATVGQTHPPQKLLVVHRFTRNMIQSEHDLTRDPGVALVVNVDGFGDQPNKITNDHEFTGDLRRRFNGFKLFYHEDQNLMTPAQVVGMRPEPDLVVY